MAEDDKKNAATDHTSSPAEILAIFFRLGLTSFGGPIAHLGYFREEFVTRRRWFSDRAYADIVALCQFMPGPASSQIGLAIGLSRAGGLGALAAWTGFTMPSALALILFGYGVTAIGDTSGAGWLRGLKIVAVAVVAQAVWGMARTLTPDARRASFAAIAAALVLFIGGVVGQLTAIVLGAIAGYLLLSGDTKSEDATFRVPVSKRTGWIALGLFAVFLFGLPLVAGAASSMALAYLDSFYRAGALVFGGGHVVLPLLQAEVVTPGWVDPSDFVAGYGAAQAVPGPLFTFAAYLGTVMGPSPTGIIGGIICLIAIFLPSAFLVVGLLPFWNDIRRVKAAQSALMGVNAAVVGLLLAALYDPVFTSAIRDGRDFALAVGAFVLLSLWKWPPWLVVGLGALAGAGLAVL